MIRMSIVEQGGAPRLVTFNAQQVTIGRAPDCDLVLTGKGVSTRHARVSLGADGVYLEDTGSTNGTFVNRQRVEGPVRLAMSDEVVLAVYQLRVFDGRVATTAVVAAHVPSAGPPVMATPPERGRAPAPSARTSPVPPPSARIAAEPVAPPGQGPAPATSAPAPATSAPAPSASGAPPPAAVDPAAAQWAREWEKIDVLARDWLARGRDSKKLLAGVKLAHAKTWLAGGRGAQPAPKREHKEFIKASYHAARRRTVGLVSIGAVVLGGAAFAAVLMLGRAEPVDLERAFASGFGSRTRTAEARDDPEARRQLADALAASASAVLEDSPEQAALVALEGVRRLPPTDRGTKAEQVFRQAMDAVTYESLHGHEGTIHDVAFSPDGRWAITAGQDRSARLWDRSGAGTIPSMALRGHIGAVGHLAVTPDGKYLFTGGDDGKIFRWTLTDADPTTTTLEVPGYEAAVSAMAVSGNGGILVSGSSDGYVRVYDVAKAVSTRLRDHTGAVRAVAIDDAGSKVVSGGADMVPILYSVSDGKPGRKVNLEGHEGEIRSVTMAGDASWAITTSDDGTARLWDPSRRVPGITVRILAGHTGAVTHAVITQDSSLAVTGGDDGKLMIWNLRADQPEVGAQTFDLHKGPITDLGTVGPGDDPDHPQPRLLLSASEDGTARTWNLETRESAQDSTVLGAGETPVRGIAATPDGEAVVTGGDDGRGRIWDPAEEGGTGPCRVARAGSPVLSLALNDVGTRLATAEADGQARLWDVITAGPVRQLATLAGHKGKLRAVAFTADSEFVATGGDDGTIRLWRANAAKPGAGSLALPGHASVVNGLAFTPDGRRLISISADRTARVWQMSKDPSKTVTVLPHGDEINSMALSTDGRWLFTGTISKLRLWDLSADDLAKSSRGLKHPHDKDIKVVAISPDGNLGLSASEDAIVVLWNFGAGGKSTRLRQHDQPVDAAAFSPDGRYMATGSRDTTIRLYDLKKPHPEESSVELTGHAQRIGVLAFAPDGGQLVSGSHDGTLRLWALDAGEGKAISATSSVLRGHDGLVSDLRLARDARFVVSSSYDGSARVWPLLHDDLLEVGCRRIGRSLTPEEWKRFLGDLPYRATCG